MEILTFEAIGSGYGMAFMGMIYLIILSGYAIFKHNLGERLSYFK